MRILILVGAAFLGGWLVSALLQPDQAPPRQGTGAPRVEAPFAPGRGARSKEAREFDDERPSHEEAARALVGGSRSLGGIAESASVELARVLALQATATFLAGDGTITGMVRDAAGEPVAGVIVTASPEAQPFGLALASRLARERAHEDRDLAAVAQESIQNELWRREVRRAAVSGSDGRFELKDLVRSGVRLVAYHDHYEIKPVNPRQDRVEPDATVDFKAQAVAEVTVDVLLPDGARPDHAWITWQGPHGSGAGAWTSQETRVRLGVGSCKVKAQAWVPAPLHSAEVEFQVASEPAQEPLLLQLEGRRVLTASVRMPEGLAMPDGVDFGIRRAEAGAEVDATTLRYDQFEHGAHTSSPGRASWYDREAGRYLIVAFLNKRSVLAHGIGVLGEEATEVELPVEEALGGRIVSLLSPDGEPTSVGAWLQLHALVEGRLRPQATRTLRRTDGSWLVATEEPEAPDELTLRISTREFGSVNVPFDARSPTALTVRFEKPGLVRLQLNRYEASPAAGRLYATLWAKEGAAATKQLASSGTCDLGWVQPAEYTLVLYVQQGNDRWTILQQPLRVHAGEQNHGQVVPSLFDLRVLAPANFRGRSMVLQCNDPALGWVRREAPIKEGVATFDALASATYEVQYGGKRHAVRLTGTAEVTLD